MEIRRAAGWSLASTGNTPAVSWGPGGAGFHVQSARQHYSRACEQHAELLQGGSVASAVCLRRSRTDTEVSCSGTEWNKTYMQGASGFQTALSVIFKEDNNGVRG